eukprot:EG_transcript_41329
MVQSNGEVQFLAEWAPPLLWGCGGPRKEGTGGVGARSVASRKAEDGRANWETIPEGHRGETKRHIREGGASRKKSCVDIFEQQCSGDEIQSNGQVQFLTEWGAASPT